MWTSESFRLPLMNLSSLRHQRLLRYIGPIGQKWKHWQNWLSMQYTVCGRSCWQLHRSIDHWQINPHQGHLVDDMKFGGQRGGHEVIQKLVIYGDGFYLDLVNPQLQWVKDSLLNVSRPTIEMRMAGKLITRQTFTCQFWINGFPLPLIYVLQHSQLSD